MNKTTMAKSTVHLGEPPADLKAYVKSIETTPPNRQVWRCNNCGYYRNSSKNCAGCDLTKSEGDARD